MVAYDDDIQEVLLKAKALPPIDCLPGSRKLHPLVQLAKRGFAETLSQKYHNRRTPVLFPHQIDTKRFAPSVEVGKTSIPRALAILDAFFKAIESIGGEIETEKKRYYTYPHLYQTNIKLCGEVITPIRLRETYRQIKRAKSESVYSTYEFVLTGCLLFDYGPDSTTKILSTDSDTVKLEARLNHALIKLVEKAGRRRIERRVQIEEQKLHEELERRKSAHHRILELRSQELKSRQDAEKKRISKLFEEANHWQSSQLLRNFVHAAVLNHEKKDNQELKNWASWALQQADRFDPLALNPPSVLDEVPSTIVTENDVERYLNTVNAKDEPAKCNKLGL